jgi:hypothetical protein
MTYTVIKEARNLNNESICIIETGNKIKKCAVVLKEWLVNEVSAKNFLWTTSQNKLNQEWERVTTQPKYDFQSIEIKDGESHDNYCKRKIRVAIKQVDKFIYFNTKNGIELYADTEKGMRLILIFIDQEQAKKVLKSVKLNICGLYVA